MYVHKSSRAHCVQVSESSSLKIRVRSIGIISTLNHLNFYTRSVTLSYTVDRYRIKASICHDQSAWLIYRPHQYVVWWSYEDNRNGLDLDKTYHSDPRPSCIR